MTADDMAGNPDSGESILVGSAPDAAIRCQGHTVPQAYYELALYPRDTAAGSL